MHTTQRSRSEKAPNLTLFAAVCAVALAGSPAWSQTGSGNTSGTNSTMSGSTSGNTSKTPGDAGMKRADNAKVDRRDAGMLNDLAKANMAEIDAGKMALEKAKSDDVRKFAQQMIDDHTKALGEVETLARAKGVTLPDGSGAMAKTKAAALNATTGDTFDKQYAKHAGVGDHEKTLKLLQKVQKDARDEELKALAAKMQPTVEHHLMMARDLANTKKKAS